MRGVSGERQGDRAGIDTLEGWAGHGGHTLQQAREGDGMTPMQSDEVDGGPVMFAIVVVYLAGMVTGIFASVVWGWL